MRLSLILDPLEQLKSYKDSSVAIMRAAAARGHDLYAIQQPDLLLKAGQVLAHARPLRIHPEDHPWYTAGASVATPLQDFDAVLMRKDPPFDMEYIFSTYLLEVAQSQGARVFNDPAAIRNFNEKLAIAKFPQFIAPTIVTRQRAVIAQFLSEEQDIIVKPLDGMGGAGVFRLRTSDPNINVILETITALETRSVMAQRYIPEIVNGDKRILLVDGEVAPMALARIPKPGETRGNLAAGGTGVAQALSRRDREIAETVAPVLKAAGLFLVGLDVIGDYLTEINVTSPTGMQEIAAQSGCDVAAMVVHALERRVGSA